MKKQHSIHIVEESKLGVGHQGHALMCVYCFMLDSVYRLRGPYRYVYIGHVGIGSLWSGINEVVR